ncbi:MAG: recombinase family protein [Patescibacteria group bacterium]
METKEEIKYFIYARKSSESEDRQVQSIDAQLDKTKILAEELGLIITKKPFIESKSAKTPNTRPVFEEMLEKIESGEANGILCWKINRLSRNPIDSGKIQWMLQQGTIKSIRTVEREYRPEDNALILSVESGTSNQFILDLSRDTKRGLDKKLEKGWLPNMAPLGYMNDKTKEQGLRDILPDPERFDLIRKMWELMLSGTYSVSEILKIANDDWGLRTRKFKKRGGKEISKSGLYRIFNNPFYYGQIIRKDGRQFQGSHIPMVSFDEFQRVQQLLGNKLKSKPRRHHFAFTGFIRCEECGCLITAEEKPPKWVKCENRYKAYVYYHCTKKKKGMICNQNKFLREEEIEKQIDQLLSEYTILPEFKDWALDILKESNEKEITERSKITENLQKAVNNSQKQLDNLTQMRIRELVTDDEYLKQKKILKHELEQNRSKIRETDERADNWLELTENIFNFATYARTRFSEGDWRTKKEILMSLGHNPTIKDGILSFQACEWLEPIRKAYPAIEKDYLALELNKKPLTKAKTEALTSVICKWGG